MKSDRLVLSKDPALLVTVDVFEIARGDLDRMCSLAVRLVQQAEGEPAFVAAAVHKAIPNEQQPRYEYGAVPKDRSWVSIYAQWRAGATRLGFAGSTENRAVLEEMAGISSHARKVLQDPEASMYEVVFFDFGAEGPPLVAESGQRSPGTIIKQPSPLGQFINIFETAPDRQMNLLDENRKIIAPANRLQGYVSGAFHRSLDGTKVVNYRQFASFHDISRMYHNLPIMFAFLKLSLRKVAVPKFRFLGLEFGTPPDLRSYTVEYIGKAMSREPPMVLDTVDR